MPLRLAHAWWGAGALLVVMDVALSLAPPGEGASAIPDKPVHFLTYFLLGFWFISLAANHQLRALVGVIFLGGLLELLQGLAPMRQPEWLDFAANSAGAVLAFGVVRLLPINIFEWAERKLLEART